MNRVVREEDEFVCLFDRRVVVIEEGNVMHMGCIGMCLARSIKKAREEIPS